MVDRYLNDLLAPSDPVLDAALHDAQQAGLPSIHVAANQGKLLALLARSIGARSILEIGTLGGYSTIWLARALPPDGRLITLEIDPKHASVAQANIARAGLSQIVDIRLGRATESLAAIAKEGAAPFDFVFIDADKINTASYLAWALKLTRRGSLIVIDNVVRKGEVANDHSDDVNVRGVREGLAMLASEPRLMATAVQTVGSKGYDGLAVALVIADA
jgi:predicted O-methyltransferase YrrM